MDKLRALPRRFASCCVAVIPACKFPRQPAGGLAVGAEEYRDAEGDDLFLRLDDLVFPPTPAYPDSHRFSGWRWRCRPYPFWW